MTAADPITGASREQLAELAKPFPDRFIEGKDGQNYVAHHIITQRLLFVVGPFDFELVREIRSDVPAQAPDPNGRSRRAKAGTPALQAAVTGVVGRLTAEIDGRRVQVEEAGDVGDVHNWPHDGARLKDAASDALKRCAMRLGLGLHLWAQEHYFLDAQFTTTPPQEPPTAAPKESKSGGTGERNGGARSTNASVARDDPAQGTPATAATPDRQTEGGTPPDFDLSHLGAKALQAWLRGQPPELRELVEEDAKAQQIDLAEADKETLHELIVAAWKVKPAA